MSAEPSERNAVWQGTLSLMVLRTLLTMGEQHGYGIARRIEQTSEGRLSINYGTLYPALLKLEQEGLIASAWGTSDNNRKAKFYTADQGRAEADRARHHAVGSDLGDHDALPGADRGLAEGTQR